MRLSSFIWFGSAALLLLLGCGGGGGGGGGGGQIAIAAPGQYIEFLRSDGTWFDPFNLQVGESGRAVIANYDSLGVRTVLPSSSWSTSFNDSTFISINPSTGKFSVVQAGGGPFFFRGWVTLGGAPVQLEQGARIPTDTPTVSGQVVEIDNFTGLPSTNGIPHVGVDFFDSIGTLVGSARTMPDGTFSGHVPTSAALMMLQGGSIRTSLYYVDVYWQGIHYSPLDATCRIAIGPLTAGDNPLPATPGIPLKTGGPPPPPSGCS